MTIAYDNNAPVFAVNPTVSSQKQNYRLWQPIRWGTALVARTGWHLRAYGTILGILLLIGLSLVVLQIHGFYEAFCHRLTKYQPKSNKAVF